MDVRFCEGRNHRRQAHERTGGSRHVICALLLSALQDLSLLLTKTYMDVGDPERTQGAVAIAPMEKRMRLRPPTSNLATGQIRIAPTN
jgi:hypothetical protein